MMRTYVNTLLLLTAALLVGACSDVADKLQQKNSSKSEDAAQQKDEQDKVKLPQEKNDETQKKEDLPPQSEKDKKPAETDKLSDCGETVDCTHDIHPATCTYHDVTLSGPNSCYATADIKQQFCEKNLPFEWKAVKCELEDPFPPIPKTK